MQEVREVLVVRIHMCSATSVVPNEMTSVLVIMAILLALVVMDILLLVLIAAVLVTIDFR